ncbi:MAG: hypothetical protein H7A55_02080 [Verrucomicrobiaceae bacterium]|nr:hypothetical protein [Verrucomicrobiaceae bacterium]
MSYSPADVALHDWLSPALQQCCEPFSEGLRRWVGVQPLGDQSAPPQQVTLTLMSERGPGYFGSIAMY